MSSTKTAARAFRRIWAEKSCALSIGAAADAGFDGGEFSAGFHANLTHEAQEQAMEAVAQRFGMTAYQLDAALHRDEDEWWARMMSES